MKYLFIDTETTGVNPDKNSVHQISGAVVITENGKDIIKEVFDIKFRPKENAVIEQEALDATHLTLEDLQSRKLSYEQGYEKLLKILDKYINRYNRADKFFLVGYNVHFDKDFLYRLFVDNGNNYLFSYIWGNHIDVMVLATVKLANERPSMINFKQGTVAKYLGFDVKDDELHDALYDIYICIGLYCYITQHKFEMNNTLKTIYV